MSVLAEPVNDYQDTVLAMRGWESFDEVKTDRFPYARWNRERL